ncbi:hypothetical protein BD769DRAFT_1336365, partial [Suillus cothurnatus]
MNYTNYEQKIVKRHSFALVSWPVPGLVRNPSKIGGRPEVNKLLDAFQDGTCHWVKLTDEELLVRMKDNRARAARGEPVYVLRKRRNRAPLKQGGT